LPNSECKIKDKSNSSNDKEERHPKFHPPKADEIHPSDGGEFASHFEN
jgi:hypothetical protein